MSTSGLFYVYEHWRPDRDECFYVGKGKGNRACSMKNRSKHHKAICAKLSRLGTSVEVRIVADGLMEENAFQLEIERIKFWREAGIDLVNLTNGGEGQTGFRHSDETKKLWSLQRKGRLVPEEGRLKRSIALKGKPKTKEHAAAAGKAGGLARTGKKQNQEWVDKRVQSMKEKNHYKIWGEKFYKPVLCVTDEKKFPSLTAAAQNYNMKKTQISHVCRGKHKHTKGLVFKFLEKV